MLCSICIEIALGVANMTRYKVKVAKPGTFVGVIFWGVIHLWDSYCKLRFVLHGESFYKLA